MTVIGVYTPECPTASDGRPMHYMVRDGDRWVCENCGTTRECHADRHAGRHAETS